MHWTTSRFVIDLNTPKVMAIINVTPDSFSDGGQHDSTSSALRHCEEVLREGAHILDIGGESTRPGSPAVPLEVELERVLPVVREAVKLGVPVSVDTYKPEVMQAVLDLGVDIVNDIWALRRTGAMDVVAAHPRCGVCLMHMHRDPQTMQVAPMEGSVVIPVRQFLGDRASLLEAKGVQPERIVLDPGVGFGKSVEQNFELLANQSALGQLPYPWLVGWSRKSSLGAVTGRATPVERASGSVVAAVLAVERGASVVRVHDVRETVDGLAVWSALLQLTDKSGTGNKVFIPRFGGETN
ncbi:dihydropteroate synthase [Hydrogenophaga pseudoflava]|uniref:dihydropteroate synthase n=1 Tax=Hydrogenophaga pseudoflava TaxID=47421 RepID=UPI0027E408C4|nr:dihydropteroate synthase [Hydrogenophaga pseudoflava]MDQ7744261.1 dihydropteroate synthase [Hydrogenophaga pseudoflava]